MPSLNKVFLMGYLGSAPEFRHTTGGIATVTISLATSSRRKDREGQMVDLTEWHRLVFFDRLAEIVRDYCRKGSLIFVEGRLQTRKWRDKNDIDRWTTEIIVASMQLLDKRENGDAARPAKEQPKPAPAEAAPGGYEDVPF